ncbi:MAG: type II secretion system protein GspG [Planctomycetes bacterium]|nr:type II secretion system protein GspG [Planctomycetota bacterium]
MSGAQRTLEQSSQRKFVAFIAITLVLLVVSVVSATLLFREFELDAREQSAIEQAQYEDEKKIARLLKAVEAYRTKRGELPASIDALRGADANEWFGIEAYDGLFVDSWGRTFRLEPTGAGFRVFSLGRDDAVGGEGLDRDLTSR